MPVSHTFWWSLDKVKGLFSRFVCSQTLCIHLGMQNVHWRYEDKQAGISRFVILTEAVAKRLSCNSSGHYSQSLILSSGSIRGKKMSISILWSKLGTTLNILLPLAANLSRYLLIFLVSTVDLGWKVITKSLLL